MNEPNHNDDPNPIPAAIGKAKERLATIFSRMFWLIPILSFVAIANGFSELGILPNTWQVLFGKVTHKVTGFQPGPYICIMTGGTLLVYWGRRDGWERILRFAHRMSIKKKWQELNKEWMARGIQKVVDSRLLTAVAEKSTELAVAMAASQLSGALTKARAEAFAQMGMADPDATDTPNGRSSQ